MIPGTIARKKAAHDSAHESERTAHDSSFIVEKIKNPKAASGKLEVPLHPNELGERASRQIAAELGRNSTQPISRREAFRTAVFELGDLFVRGLRGLENVKRDLKENLDSKL